MKKQVVKALAQIGMLVVIATVSAVGSAQGQSLAHRLRANIPFDFEVADKKLPAGEYLIGRASQGNGDNLLLISKLRGNSGAFRLTTPVTTLDPSTKARLVFNRYGDQYFLSEVWAAGVSTGRMFSQSRAERAAKAVVASHETAMKTGTITIVGSPE